MRFKNYLNEAKDKAIKANIKKKINKEIYKVLKPTHFREIPLQDIFDILENYGIVPIQEDNTYWSGMLIGGRKKTEQVKFDLAWKDSKEGQQYTSEIKNTFLNLSYYIMPESGRYEVIAYMS